MGLYRAAYGAGLDGIGATFAGGRWHTRGARVVYFGASAAIVLLERLAHIDPDLLPTDLRLACFEFPDSTVAVKAEEIAALPDRWIHDEDVSRKIGDQWWNENTSPLLVIPSAILPEESNYVLNARHPEAKSLRLVRERAFTIDPRLL